MSDQSLSEAIHLYEQKHGQPFQPKAVLLDMDGVLYDSMRFHAQSWQEVAETSPPESHTRRFLHVRRKDGQQHHQ